MPNVPDNVKSWLSGVVRNDYRNIDRTYGDIVRTLEQHAGLRPRTEIYTYENGVSALLVLVSGTIDVVFRGQHFFFPIHLWIPHAYPRDAPLAYVVPVENMVVRPGQHVSGDGRIYHPYLANWPNFADRSSLLDLVAILRDVFAKEPPVMSKQAQQAPPPPRPPNNATPPPPLPAPPDDPRQQQLPTPRPREYSSPPLQEGAPPPLPPKDADGMRSTPMSPMNGRPPPPHQGPPLPPLPPQHTPQHTPQQRPPSQGHWQSPPPPHQQYNVSRQSSLRHEHVPYTPVTVLPPHMRTHEMESPVSPMTPPDSVPPQQYQQYVPQQGLPPPQDAPRHMYQQSRHPPQQPVPYFQQPPPNYGHPPQQQPPQPQQRLPRPQVDLLSSPLDVQLPGQPGSDISAAPAPVPPVPPNPQKDALLQAISQALVLQANQEIASNQAALQSLSAQHQALLAAQHTLQSELDSLAHLSSILDSNDTALRQGTQQIDQSIAASTSQRRPEIDAIIISPTVVGQQVYNAVAEEQAARDVRLALGRALDKGRIGVREYVKEMRGVGREEFFRKAVVRKAGVGMGLEMGAMG